MVNKSPLELWAAALAAVVLITGLLLTAPKHNSDALADPATVKATDPQPPSTDAAAIEPADVFEPGFDFVPVTRKR